jgi:hypothetical protein
MAQTIETEIETCYGVHPETGALCVLGDHHRGYHESDDGARWLDD